MCQILFFILSPSDVHSEAVQAALERHSERKMAVLLPSKRRSLIGQTSMDTYTPPGVFLLASVRKRTVCTCVCVWLLYLPVFVQTHPLALTLRGLWGGRGVSTWTPGSAELSTAHLQRHRRPRLTATALPTLLDWRRPACTPMAVSLRANTQTCNMLDIL